jgi:hypothetical protein
MTRRAGRRLTPWLLALAGYTALTLALTWPLVLRLSAVVPHDAGDPLFTTWILWWNAHTLPLTGRWWNVPMFWPMRGAMALSEHMLGLSLVATPLQWLGADPITAYNVLFLLSFPLCALAAHGLGHALTERHDAAAIAGLVFAFNPYRTSQLAHLHILWAFWMPLALTALHRYARDGRRQWLFVFAAAWIGQALSNGYFQLFFPLLLGMWALWFLASARDLRRLAAVVVTFCVGAVAVLPVAVPYLRFHKQLALERSYSEIATFSADLRSLTDAPPHSLASALLPPAGNAEQHLFPGFAALALVVIAMLAPLRSRAEKSPTRRRVQLMFAALACVFVVMSITVQLGHPWWLRAGGTTIVSVTTAVKPLTSAIWCAIFAIAASGTLARAARGRSAFAFYVCAAVAMYVLSLGPQPGFLGAPFWYRAPYAWLMELPGFQNVRAPARFAMLGQLCLAVAAALAFASSCDRLPRRFTAAAAIVALLGVLADGWIRTLPLASLPERFTSLELSGNGAVVELPMSDMISDLPALYRSMYHHRPTVNGYSGFMPVHYAVLREAIETDGIDAFDGLTPHGPLTFVDSSGRVVATRERRAADPIPNGHTLAIREVTVDHTPLDLAALTDRNAQTRWDSGWPQRGTESITIDLGSVGQVNAVTLAIGSYYADFPRLLTIDVSEDLHAWTTRWSGRCGAKAVAAAVEDARLVPLTVVFPPVTARYVRLRQLGADKIYHWSIAEVSVYGDSIHR